MEKKCIFNDPKYINFIINSSHLSEIFGDNRLDDLLFYGENEKIDRHLYSHSIKFVEFINEKKENHRDDDRPARIYHNIERELISIMWYKNGQIHRENDKPAHIYIDNDRVEKVWYKNDLRHREGNLPTWTCVGKEKYIERYCKHHKWYRNFI